MSVSDKEMKCRSAKKCGACQLSNMDYDRQLRFKQAGEVKLFGRYGHVNEIISMGTPYHYRNKAQYGVRNIRGRIVCGVYQSATGNIVQVKDCFLNDVKSNKIASYICAAANELGISAYDARKGSGQLRHIMIRNAKATNEYMVVLVSFEEGLFNEDKLTRRLCKKFPEIKTVVLNRSKSAKMTLGASERILFGSGYIEDILCGKRFRISPRSFYQVNPTQTQALYDTAIGFAQLKGGERVLDAYCGIGTIGICASDKAGSIVGVEQNEAAVLDARQNAMLNSVKNAVYHCGDAAAYMRQAAEEGEQFDVVFTDPPRAGCSKVFLQSLVTLAPKRVVYISCDPNTLARDLAFLARNGFQIRSVQPVDMFPHTRHVETAVLLSRK